MYKFFDYCLSLETVDFGAGGLSGEAKNEKIRSKLDTSGAYDMSNLLYQCGELDPSDKFYEAFQFDSAKRISRMLYGIYNNSTLDNIEIVFSDKNMSSVVDNPGLSPNPPCGIQQMFQDSHVSKVTVRNCNMENIINSNSVKDMFIGSKVKEIEFVDCNISGLTGYGTMFKNATSLETVRFNGTNLSGITSMKDMFLGCESLQNVQFSDNIDLSHVTTFEGMLNNCKSFSMDAFGNMTKSWNLDGSSINFNNKVNANFLIKGDCAQLSETRTYVFADGKKYKIGGSLKYLVYSND